MDTYDFCAGLVSTHALNGAKVLDYGCGAGQIVTRLRAKGLNAQGCDVFYEGGDYSKNIPTEMRPFIQRMQGDRIPFEDAQFDVVISNQVMEHVPDLDVVVREISRVLKPGGIAFSVFPDRGVWREGHCGVPFLHRFPKGSVPRIYYAAVMGSLGLGSFRNGKPLLQWARDFCIWLDRWTHYRSVEQIHAIFGSHFGTTTHREELWFDARFQNRGRSLPAWLRRFVVRKFAGMVLISTGQQRL